MLTALLCLVLAGAPARSQEEAAYAYRLGSGDRVKITVFGHPDLSGEFAVDGSGKLSLPLIRELPAAGLSVSEVEEAITDKLRPDYLRNPRVSVEVLSYRPFYILGEVKNPGSYAYVEGMTVVNAVALAGGYTYRAKSKAVKITRATDSGERKLPAGPDTVVLPGDIIEVPERFF